MKTLGLLLVLALGAAIAVLRSLDEPAQPAPRATKVHHERVQPVPVVATLEPPPALREPERNAANAIADRRVELQARFTEQRVDASWAGSARQQLRDDLGKYATDSVNVRDVECRSTLCRIEVAAASRDAQQSFMESWARSRTWTGAGFAATDGDALVVFVSRPGIDLP